MGHGLKKFDQIPMPLDQGEEESREADNLGVAPPAVVLHEDVRVGPSLKQAAGNLQAAPRRRLHQGGTPRFVDAVRRNSCPYQGINDRSLITSDSSFQKCIAIKRTG